MKPVKLFGAMCICLVMHVWSAGVVQAKPEGDGEGKLYMPIEVSKAYENGTRSRTGKPGPNYWQNRTDYNIAVQIEPKSRVVTGSEVIAFHNNSPDTLRMLVFQLNQNMNKKGGVRNSLLAPEAVIDGMDVTSLKVNGTALKLDAQPGPVTIRGAVMFVRPPQPIAPGSETEFNLDWNFVIPKGSNIRMGTYNDDVFFLGYWYPKLAVYDDVHGWDTFAYNGEHEFYNEYGDYTVAITVPNTYGVWGTGSLTNPEDVLSRDIAARYTKASRQRSIVHVIGKSDLERGTTYRRDGDQNTWEYHASYVPDFAFGMAEHYVWDAASVEVDGGRRVGVHVVYDTATAPFKVVAEEAAQAVEYFSTEFPGIAYPYPQITVFRGDYGMEYPMIVNDGVFPNRISNVYVHTHEIAHQYFPFYVGTNETMYAWMDEGWAYALPFALQQRLSDYDHRIRAMKGYERYAGSTYDVPLMTPSTCLRAPDLDMASYYKPAVAYELLKGVLGEETYIAAVQEYIRRWNGKHPLPWDFFYSIEDATKEDLHWFWQPWFFGEGVPDLAISDVTTDGDAVRFLVKNLGAKPIPIHATIQPREGDPVQIAQSAAVWQHGATEFWIDANVPGGVTSIKLGGDLIPDSRPENNSWTADE